MFVCCLTPPLRARQTLNAPPTRRAACPGPAAGGQGARARSRTPTTSRSPTRIAGVLVRQEHETQTVTLVLDATIAIATHADEREARVREIEQISRSLPEGSYGSRNLKR